MKTLQFDKKPSVLTFKQKPRGLSVDVRDVDNSLMVRMRRARSVPPGKSPGGLWAWLLRLLGRA